MEKPKKPFAVIRLSIIVYCLPFTVYQLLFKIDVKVMVKKMFFMFFFHPV